MSAVMKWQVATLRQIVETDDLHVAPFRRDGVTPGTPTWIWCVEVDGDLYVRAYHGASSRWHQAALAQGAGRIRAAGLMRDVAFAAVDGPLLERVDAAYRAKYAGSPYLEAMIGARARGATVRIDPRCTA